MFQATIFTLNQTKYEITYSDFDFNGTYYIFSSVTGERNGEKIELKTLRLPIINTIVERTK